MVKDQAIPLRYRIDHARIIEDIILQPQLMIQARLDYGALLGQPAAPLRARFAPQILCILSTRVSWTTCLDHPF